MRKELTKRLKKKSVHTLQVLPMLICLDLSMMIGIKDFCQYTVKKLSPEKTTAQHIWFLILSIFFVGNCLYGFGYALHDVVGCKIRDTAIKVVRLKKSDGFFLTNDFRNVKIVI